MIEKKDTGNKKGRISLGGQQFYYLQVFQDLTNHRKKTSWAVVFSCRNFPNILKIQGLQMKLQQSSKQDSFRHFLKSSVFM